MNFRNLQKAPNYKVSDYLKQRIPNVTNQQKWQIYDVVDESPFKFYERRPYTPNVWLRMSIVFVPFVWMILFLGMPFTYLFTGSWGYGSKLNWIMDWFDKLK